MITPISYGCYSSPVSNVMFGNRAANYPTLSPTRFGEGSQFSATAPISDVRFGRHRKAASLDPVQHYMTQALEGTVLNLMA